MSIAKAFLSPLAEPVVVFYTLKNGSFDLSKATVKLTQKLVQNSFLAVLHQFLRYNVSPSYKEGFTPT